MIEKPPATSNIEQTEGWQDRLFDIQRQLTGGYSGTLPSEDEANRMVKEAECIAQEIEGSGVTITEGLKADLSVVYGTAKGRGLADAAPTLKRLGSRG